MCLFQWQQLGGNFMSANILDSMVERLSDRLNPILIKEARQALKSRQFASTFLLLLLVAWLISALGVMWAGPSIEYGSPARFFLTGYTWVLEAAVLLVVPFTVFRSMQSERDQDTFELLSISTLKPRQIVWGKFCSAMLQTFLFYSAIAPFIAFTSLLQGFDFFVTLFLLGVLLVWSISVTIFALMLSTIGEQKTWQVLNMLGILGLLLWQMFMSFGLSASVMMEQLPFEDREFWWVMGALLLACASYFYLAVQISVSRLTFESDNRSTGIRIACSAQFWLLWLVVLGYRLACDHYGVHFETEFVYVAVITSCLHWSVVGLFACTETDFLSRRVRRGVPRSTFFRVLVAPWLPGGKRALAYFIGHLLALAVIVEAILGYWSADFKGRVHAGASDLETIRAVMWASISYVVIYVTYGAFFGRLAARVSPQLRPAHARVLTVLMAAVATIAPLIPVAFELVRVSFGVYSLIYVTNPLMTISHVSAHPLDMMSGTILQVLGVTACFGVLFNVPAILQGLREVVFALPKPGTQAAPALQPATEQA